jgi:hypothetical protein
MPAGHLPALPFKPLDANDDLCYVCKLGAQQGFLLCCESCPMRHTCVASMRGVSRIAPGIATGVHHRAVDRPNTRSLVLAVLTVAVGARRFNDR